MKLRHPCKCVTCGEIFEPDPRCVGRQKTCHKPTCKAALRAARNRRWVAKNSDYHRGPEQVARVTAWKQAKAGHHWKAKPSLQDALTAQHADYTGGSSRPPSTQTAELIAKVQDALPLQPADFIGPHGKAAANSGTATNTLQDALSVQDIVLIGLIAHMSDSTVQDAVLNIRQGLLQLGLNVLGGKYADAAK
jgi:hypothetical protein